jgi:23S rRNA pseudouridine1911/1915/1917 synthase
LKKDYITVNEKTATSATMIIGGESICLTIPEEAKVQKPFLFPLKVMFEDEHLAVIHKPAGVLVSGNSFKTIANALNQNIQTSPLVDSVKPQPVHRLDFATTGALLIGKTSSCIRALTKMFEKKQIQKSYYAITIGEMKEEEGEGEGEISSPIDGKTSLSHFQVIETIPSPRFGQLNLLKLNPQTGRRHQLRIHLSRIGNPILGDKDYGIENLILNGKGLYLHAYSLSFVHPFTLEKAEITSEFPERFRKIFPSL